ncbi:Zn-ribbon containing protein [Candidatus Tiddalikarchaeum anstoanum]|nr:Zn-ribbon containing protein [Candidatus Tiddalikarchaeum anstoanum]
MPHQCVRCGELYDDGSKELLEGCGKCKGKFFFYIRKDRFEEQKQLRTEIPKEELSHIEKDVRSLMPKVKREEPVILDIETIRVVGPGKYEIDISSLMRGNPVIIQVGEGKYFIDLFTVMKPKIKK